MGMLLRRYKDKVKEEEKEVKQEKPKKTKAKK